MPRLDRVTLEARAGTDSGYGPLYCVTAKFSGSQSSPAPVRVTVTLRLVTEKAWLFGLVSARSSGWFSTPGASFWAGDPPETVKVFLEVSTTMCTWAYW